MKQRCAGPVFILLLQAGCAAIEAVAPGPEERAIRRYYEAFAVESGATCTRPRIDTITESERIERTAETTVYRVRYAFEPFHWSDTAYRQMCTGFGERRFVLQNEEPPRVSYMSGMQYKSDKGAIKGVDLETPKPKKTSLVDMR